jgi:hypothetical protein
MRRRSRSADEDKIPDFSRRNREICRFSPRNRHLAAKTVRQIRPLPANSRGSANREFTPAQPGIKLAELGIVAKKIWPPRRPTTAEHHKRTRNTLFRPVEMR